VVVVARAWAKNYGNRASEPCKVISGTFKPFITTTAYNRNLGNEADNYPAYRHADIEPPRIDRNGEVFEYLDGYVLDLSRAEYAAAKGCLVPYNQPSRLQIANSIEAIGQKISTRVRNAACAASLTLLENDYHRMHVDGGHILAEAYSARHIGKVKKVPNREWPDEVAARKQNKVIPEAAMGEENPNNPPVPRVRRIVEGVPRPARIDLEWVARRLAEVGTLNPAGEIVAGAGEPEPIRAFQVNYAIEEARLLGIPEPEIHVPEHMRFEHAAHENLDYGLEEDDD